MTLLYSNQDSIYLDARRYWALLNHFQTNQGHCTSCRKKWGLAATDMCPCGKCQTMSNIVNSC